VEVIEFRQIMKGLAGQDYELQLTEGAALVLCDFEPVTVITNHGPLELWQDHRSNVRRYYSRAKALICMRYRQIHGEGPHNIFTGPLPGPIGSEEQGQEGAA